MIRSVVDRGRPTHTQRKQTLLEEVKAQAAEQAARDSQTIQVGGFWRHLMTCVCGTSDLSPLSFPHGGRQELEVTVQLTEGALQMAKQQQEEAERRAAQAQATATAAQEAAEARAATAEAEAAEAAAARGKEEEELRERERVRGEEARVAQAAAVAARAETGRLQV